MKVLMSWSGGRFDLVVCTKEWLLVASTMVSAEVHFWQDTFFEEVEVKTKATTWIKVFYGDI